MKRNKVRVSIKKIPKSAATKVTPDRLDVYENLPDKPAKFSAFTQVMEYAKAHPNLTLEEAKFLYGEVRRYYWAGTNIEDFLATLPVIPVGEYFEQFVRNYYNQNPEALLAALKRFEGREGIPYQRLAEVLLTMRIDGEVGQHGAEAAKLRLEILSLINPHINRISLLEAHDKGLRVKAAILGVLNGWEKFGFGETIEKILFADASINRLFWYAARVENEKGQENLERFYRLRNAALNKLTPESAKRLLRTEPGGFYDEEPPLDRDLFEEKVCEYLLTKIDDNELITLYDSVKNEALKQRLLTKVYLCGKLSVLCAFVRKYKAGSSEHESLKGKIRLLVQSGEAAVQILAGEMEPMGHGWASWAMPFMGPFWPMRGGWPMGAGWIVDRG